LLRPALLEAASSAEVAHDKDDNGQRYVLKGSRTGWKDKGAQQLDHLERRGLFKTDKLLRFIGG